MYLPVIYSLILSALTVVAVRHFQMPADEADAETSKSQKKTLFATGFFMFIVLLIGFHLMGIGESTVGTHGSMKGGHGSSKYDYEVPMVQQMNQHIQTGFAPF